MNYRLLTGEEISRLIANGCMAADWSAISVADNFSASCIRNTRFEGKIRLGALCSSDGDDGSLSGKCGIFNSRIRDCVISDNVYISDVKNLADYDIGENARIGNVGSIGMSGESAFGNGTPIEVLNEGGGRSLPIFDRLSSQIAYLAVLYRHDKAFTEKLLGLIGDYSASRLSSRGTVGSHACITDTGTIRDVSIGPHAVIAGASLLEDGTIGSCREAPAFIGEGVIAKKFIVLSGSRIDGGAIVDKTFIGQSVRMGKQYSAENSLFFANCEAFHGEGCSIFAGPYTVTHHKSTLLIASLFSFFNAGSGTNQSNHMYKLGPVHQGILERGSKTGSYGYLLLPCRVGPFTVVMGSHYSNFDSSEFPFSYVTSEKGKSELTPAMNIFTVGTRRDSEKWATRDKRNDPEKLDLINFSLFNPFIVSRILDAINLLNDFAEKTPKTQDFVNYKGMQIHRLLLKASRKYYEMALKIYMGQELVKRIEDITSGSKLDEIRSRLTTSGKEGEDKWVEISGLFAPAGRIASIMESVRSGAIGSVNDLQTRLEELHNSFEEYSWQWCAQLIGRQTGTPVENITASALIGILADWKTNAVKFSNMILKDAEKEFDTGARLGFGVDGDVQTRDLDFLAVRGDYNENRFVQGLQSEIISIGEKAGRLISILEMLQID